MVGPVFLGQQKYQGGGVVGFVAFRWKMHLLFFLLFGFSVEQKGFDWCSGLRLYALLPIRCPVFLRCSILIYYIGFDVESQTA